MILAHAANRIGTSARSVLRTGCIFDTPPLKGLRLLPRGSE